MNEKVAALWEKVFAKVRDAVESANLQDSLSLKFGRIANGLSVFSQTPFRELTVWVSEPHIHGRIVVRDDAGESIPSWLWRPITITDEDPPTLRTLGGGPSCDPKDNLVSIEWLVLDILSRFREPAVAR
jgi:hypothetical protein